jgi:hypothetical protein
MTQPYDVPLFDLPATAAAPNAKVPIAIPRSYAEASRRAGGQCEATWRRSTAKDAPLERCAHVERYYRLFVCDDGVLRCETCAKKVEAAARKLANPRPTRKRAKR